MFHFSVAAGFPPFFFPLCSCYPSILDNLLLFLSFCCVRGILLLTACYNLAGHDTLKPSKAFFSSSYVHKRSSWEQYRLCVVFYFYEDVDGVVIPGTMYNILLRTL
ncbi:hypothetical protein QBC36DRAFT_64099 [Triangularia setosa]|uniref:Uncharacterized protein n=1 Tax=Triangularia setosa TaxID=2587417 RepID=A0AAN7A4L5_9PEZI|nr:hypothetical protein QBC36DRAFT_64099 [Podospora setosa]